VWDATRSNGWENHNHYSGGYGGYGHGRWLKSEKAQENTSEQQKDNKPQESTPAAGDKVEGGKSRNLLGTQEWGSGMFLNPPIHHNCLNITAVRVANPQNFICAVCSAGVPWHRRLHNASVRNPARMASKHIGHR
jgi:hypothetical protein